MPTKFLFRDVKRYEFKIPCRSIQVALLLVVQDLDKVLRGIPFIRKRRAMFLLAFRPCAALCH